MPRRYRVLHVITRLDLGGAQQNTLFCTAHHDRERFDVELLAGAGGILDAEALQIADAGVSLVSWLPHAIRPAADALSVLRLRGHLRRADIDLLHTHSSKAGILGRLAGLLAGVPVVVHTVHGWSFNATQPAWQRRLYVLLERAAAAITDRLIVVSALNREAGLSLHIGVPEQYAVVHSGIDIEAFRRPARDRARVRAELGFDPTHTVVGSIACLKPQKAPLDFVRAAASACARNSALRFFVAGDGELRADVEAQVAASGFGDRIRLLGWRDDVVDLLHAMDIFLLTSLHEGLPRAVLQAMAAGTPVVATAVDGTPEVIEHRESGLLVPAGEPERAAAAVLELAADRELALRLAERAASRLGREFEIRQMVRDLDGLYLELLEGRGRG